MYFSKLKPYEQSTDFIRTQFNTLLQKSLKKDWIDFEEVNDNWWIIWSWYAPTFNIYCKNWKSYSLTLICEKELYFLPIKHVVFVWGLSIFNWKKITIRLPKFEGEYLNYVWEKIKWKMQVENIFLDWETVYFENIKFFCISWMRQKQKNKYFTWKWEYKGNSYLIQNDNIICLPIDDSISKKVNFVKVEQPQKFKKLSFKTNMSLEELILSCWGKPISIDLIIEFYKWKKWALRKTIFKPLDLEKVIIRWRKTNHEISFNISKNKDVNYGDLDKWVKKSFLKENGSDGLTFLNSPNSFWINWIEYIFWYKYQKNFSWKDIFNDCVNNSSFKYIPKCITFQKNETDYVLYNIKKTKNRITTLHNKFWKAFLRIED